MDTTVEEEFEKIRENLGKNIQVSSTRFERDEEFKGRLDELNDFLYVKLYLGPYGTGSVHKVLAFIGAGMGIVSIKDEAGSVLYENPGLEFTKHSVDYNPFFDKEDNDAINALRRSKFGEGHDYKIIRGS
tara:strand:+ start:11652 stop:12041 length:390 start_codon:yes stop_codon:yes gene_type:complete